MEKNSEEVTVRYKTKLGSGAIAGIVIGGIIFIALIVTAIILLLESDKAPPRKKIDFPKKDPISDLIDDILKEEVNKIKEKFPICDLNKSVQLNCDPEFILTNIPIIFPFVNEDIIYQILTKGFIICSHVQYENSILDLEDQLRSITTDNVQKIMNVVFTDIKEFIYYAYKSNNFTAKLVYRPSGKSFQSENTKYVNFCFFCTSSEIFGTKTHSIFANDFSDGQPVFYLLEGDSCVSDIGSLFNFNNKKDFYLWSFPMTANKTGSIKINRYRLFLSNPNSYRVSLTDTFYGLLQCFGSGKCE